MAGRFQTRSVQTFQPKIVFHRRGNFDYYHWGLIYIYCPYSSPNDMLTVCRVRENIVLRTSFAWNENMCQNVDRALLELGLYLQNKYI